MIQSAAQRMLDMTLTRQVVSVAVVAGLVGWWDGDWPLGVAVLSLWLIWAIVPAVDGPPVLALALTYQWVQCTAGLFYVAVTGRWLGAIFTPDYRQMIVLSLGCVLSLAIGLRLGAQLLLKDELDMNRAPSLSLRVGWMLLGTGYLLPIAAEPTLIQLAFDYPSVGQAILALRFVRLAALYLMLRRFVQTRQWHFFAGLIVLELLLAFTSFYAGFREPLIAAIAALIERFHPRRLVQWAGLIVLVVAGSLLGLAWLGVRETYRADYDSDLVLQTRESRSTRLTSLGREFFQSDPEAIALSMDQLVERLWAIQYPALVLGRVPALLPHTDGELFTTALMHVFTPRIFFPNKPGLESDSELVRRYAGVWVAGEEQGTSIAFGYAIESYIDFGVPYMFLPSLGWGIFLGLAFGWLTRNIHTHELRIGLLMVVFWLALYLFERSWAKTMGTTGTLLIYLGLPAVVLDRVLFRRAQEQLTPDTLIGLGPAPPSPAGRL